MKKIISLMTVVAMIVSMSSLTAFAANTRTVTLSATVESANAGDEFDAIATLDTSNTVKTLGLKIAFDPNDIELGISAESKAVESEYAEYIGTPDFPTLDSVTETMLGRKSYVSDTYANTYAGYAATKNLGAATVDYEVKDGLGRVTFGYAISNAKNALNKIDGMVVGGAVLKVKTSEKKQTTIKLIETSTSDNSNTQYFSTVNEVVINLNGYDPNEVPAPAGPSANITNSTETVDEYTFTNSEEMANKKVLLTKAAAVTLTDTTKFTVTQTSTGKTKTFTNILSSLAQGGGSVNVANVKFGIIVDSNVAASDFTFAIN